MSTIAGTWQQAKHNRSTSSVVLSASTHIELHVGVEHLGDELHGWRHHGVLLPHRNLNLVHTYKYAGEKRRDTRQVNHPRRIRHRPKMQL